MLYSLEWSDPGTPVVSSAAWVLLYNWRRYQDFSHQKRSLDMTKPMAPVVLKFWQVTSTWYPRPSPVFKPCAAPEENVPSNTRSGMNQAEGSEGLPICAP